MDAIFKYFDSFLKISPESKELIAAHLEYELVKKGEFLWRAGQRCNNLYFIISGITRLFFYTEEGLQGAILVK